MRRRARDLQSDTGSSRRSWVRAVAVGAVMLCVEALALPAARAQQRGDSTPGRRVTSGASVPRRGHPLKAVQLLEYRPTGEDARVRFEWNHVHGAREYRLVGRWTGTVSWAVQAREYAVNARSATTWTSQRVTFEVPLPLGNHSWRLIAVFRPNDVRVVGDSTPLSFAVK